MNILLIGSGGREHALAWKLAQSDQCDTLFCAPGNAGIENVATCVALNIDDYDTVIEFIQVSNIEFVVVGPEQPLVDGLASALREAGIAVFGPNKDAAALEGSKGFMKDFCKRHAIPTAAYERFTAIDQAKDYLKTQTLPIVIKTDGLAAGKGVIIAQTLEEAQATVEDMLSGNAFGSAGTSIVIEEFMDGEEISYFALADGKTFLPLTSAQDHKRVGDGDTGLNTGGMGAYSPAHFMTDDLEQKICDQIIQPTVDGMAKDGMPFQGVLFAGLMVVNGAPKLIEFNIRFGDPECQPMMMRLESDLLPLLMATDSGTLAAHKDTVQWRDQTALCVVMATKGYPGSYEKGTPIHYIGAVDGIKDAYLFHAGTMTDNSGTLISTGGRVFGAVGMADTVQKAQNIAYNVIDLIDWPAGFCRRDIGWRAIEAAKTPDNQENAA